jgi:Na+-driven multidrug efflux pump
MAVSTLVGQNIGAGNIQRASRIALLGTGLGFSILTLVGVIAFAFAPLIVAFFVPHDPEVIAEGARFIRIICLAWGGMGIQLCVVATFRASGNMLMAMVIALVSQFMIQFPLAYVLSKHTLEAHGLWWSFPITNVLVAVVSLSWFARGSWKTMRLTEQDKETAKVTDEAIIEEGLR